MTSRPSLSSLSNNEDKFYTDWEESSDSFDQMNLHENLLRGIYAYGELMVVQFVIVLSGPTDEVPSVGGQVSKSLQRSSRRVLFPSPRAST